MAKRFWKGMPISDIRYRCYIAGDAFLLETRLDLDPKDRKYDAFRTGFQSRCSSARFHGRISQISNSTTSNARMMGCRACTPATPAIAPTANGMLRGNQLEQSKDSRHHLHCCTSHTYRRGEADCSHAHMLW